MAEQSTPAQGEKYVPILSRLSPPKGAVKSKRRKGRGPGSGLGKTAGKGQKGQKARHPGDFGKLHFEGGQSPIQRRLPKVGFWNPFSKVVATVNVGDLQVFPSGTVVDIAALREARLVRGRRFDGVKVLGDGDLGHALTVRAHAFSASAKAKIEKAGGKAEVIEARASTAEKSG
jgi:large subunit ribosomal protein L15